jgi:uncharacterized membrane protein YeaQ/YmgE (transglycosylase-associated protein family)
MSLTLSDLLVWLVIGGLAGSLAGMVVTAKWQGLGRWTSLGVGLVGALIGGVIFKVLNIAPNLDTISISLRDVLAAFVGSLIFLAILWVFRMRNPGGD